MTSPPPRGDDPIEGLCRAAFDFALELTQTCESVLHQRIAPFAAFAAPPDRLIVRQDPPQGLRLKVDGVEVLGLRAEFYCTWDHQQHYLAVETSKFMVGLIGTSEPLFRFDYLRSSSGSAPVSHLQVHGHRDAMTYAMLRAGLKSRRGKRRIMSLVGAPQLPTMKQLHFTTGGHRYRPCLEDLLQMLLDEFGVDCAPNALEVIEAGRTRWRLHQLAASVRDSPGTAARVLTELGYLVTPPSEGGHPDRLDKLKSY